MLYIGYHDAGENYPGLNVFYRKVANVQGIA